MTTIGRELVWVADVEVARAEVAEHLSSNAHGDAERALAQYAPRSQALIVTATFAEALERARDDGDMGSDAVHRAARATEAVIAAIPDTTAEAAVRELPDDVLGAVLGSSAGDAASAVADRIDLRRIEELLANDPGLFAYEYRDSATGEFRRRFDASHCIRLVWTVLQTDDARARGLLTGKRMNLDLIALPIAERLAGMLPGEDVDIGAHEHVCNDPAMVGRVLGDAADGAEDAAGGFFAQLRAAERDGPDTLDLNDNDLTQLLDRVRELAPVTFRKILARARTMDPAEIRATFEREAGEHVAAEVVAAAADDMFAPLDELPKG